MNDDTGEKISKGIRKRYLIVVVLCFTTMLIGILVVAFRIQFAEGAEWAEWKNKQQRENVVVPANRGNIFSDQDLLMAVTVPSFALYMDFQTVHKDTLNKYMKPLCKALSQKIGDFSPAQFEARLRRGQQMAARDYLVHPRRVSYADWKEIKSFPLFDKGRFQSGLYEKKYLERQKMFGSLASRTIGDIYADFDKGGRNGLELRYDSLLRGSDGISTRQKVAGKYINVNQRDPVDGWDIKTTINIPMQDIVESALNDMLIKTGASSGTAVLMEVKTGKIKAISNLGQTASGSYREIQNYAVSDLSEPGSTFKTIAMMAALEEGKLQAEDSVDTYKGLVRMYGQSMRDHNQEHGGYGKITAAQSLWFSSNIGISTLIDRAFADDPVRFVDRLYKMKLNQTVDLEIPGAGYPDIPHPKDENRYWAKTDLPWMSIGYVVRIPPIYTLMYYNAIANDACMVKPYFVEKIYQDKQVYQHFAPEVLNSKICSKKTLVDIRAMLENVVDKGTGSAVKSLFFPIAGKTGTAVLSKGASGYRAGGKNYQVSFCGYFPADRPKYSAIVVIRDPQLGYASGGVMAGGVFKKIAEQIYAREMWLNQGGQMQNALSESVLPPVKNGLQAPTMYVMDKLRIPYDNSALAEAQDYPVISTRAGDNNTVLLEPRKLIDNLVPNVLGMGARDAVLLLEQWGLNVRLRGQGRVVQQSLRAGTQFRPGQEIVIRLNE